VKQITIIIPPEFHSVEDMILSKIRSGQKIDHFETVRLTKSGERLEVSLSISPVRDEHGKIVGAAKIARDITESKRVERALRITEKLAAAGRLAATVAHEINNPLESVTNFVYLAKTTPGLPPEVCEYLKHADQELSRVTHIARQTLGFYRDSARPTWLEASRVIDDIVTVYQQKLINKSIVLRKKVTSGLKLCAVEGELKQVVSNLLANAIEASEEKGKIQISARKLTGADGKPMVRLTIADTGEGIAADHQARLFDPFYTTKKDVGTGLGLWITKELIQKAGGRIRMRSRVGDRSGTVVAVILPFQTETASAQVA
jgi:signal transduction histidine kinase